MSVVHPTFIRTYADYLDWVATSPEAIVVGPFRILPNVDPYNYRQLDGYRMHGHCHHLAAGGATQYRYQADAVAWAAQHVAKYH